MVTLERTHRIANGAVAASVVMQKALNLRCFDLQYGLRRPVWTTSTKRLMRFEVANRARQVGPNVTQQYGFQRRGHGVKHCIVVWHMGVMPTSPPRGQSECPTASIGPCQ
jgi:hypothetical protein